MFLSLEMQEASLVKKISCFMKKKMIMGKSRFYFQKRRKISENSEYSSSEDEA